MDSPGTGDNIYICVLVITNAPSYDANESDEDRLGTTVCCVVDVSGSLGTTVTSKNDQGKIESHGLTILGLVKHSIKTIIHCLGAQDKLSIVSYNTNVSSVITSTAMTEARWKEKSFIPFKYITSNKVYCFMGWIRSRIKRIR